MIKVTNNMWVKIECTDKMIEILAIIYTNDLYVLQKGEYNEAEDIITQRWLALWNIFWGTLTVLPGLQILPELLSQRDEDWEYWNIILDKLFWAYEKQKI